MNAVPYLRQSISFNYKLKDPQNCMLKRFHRFWHSLKKYTRQSILAFILSPYQSRI